MPVLQLEVLRDDGEHTGYSFAVICVVRYAQGRALVSLLSMHAGDFVRTLQKGYNL